jgi:site-specific recombinase XerD
MELINMLIYKGIDIPNAQIVQAKYGDKMIHIIWSRKGKFADEEHEHDQKFCGRPSRPLMKYDDINYTIEQFEKNGCQQCFKKLEKLYAKVTAPKEPVIPEELLLVNKVRVNSSDDWSTTTNLELINSWKNDDLRYNGKSDGTIEKYENILNQLVMFSNKPLNEIVFEDIHQFLLLETKRAITTKQLNLYAIHRFFNWAYDKNLLPMGNPCTSKDAKRFELSGRKRRSNRSLSQEEVDCIANYMKKKCKREDYLGFLILLETGLRVSEVIDLKVEQMRLTQRGFYEITAWCIKQKQERLVAVSPELTNEIQGYLEKRGIETGYVLRNEYGQKLATGHFNTLFEKIARLLDIEHFSPHSLRHTFGTTIYNGTKDIKMLQELLGHASLNTTTIYTHVTNEQKVNTMQTYAPRVVI